MNASLLSRLSSVPQSVSRDLPLILRLTGAALSTYLFIKLTFGRADLTGALAALLIVQASVFSTFRVAAERITAVLLGVGVAALVSSTFGMNLFTLGLVIFVGLLVSSSLRFKDNFLETPISAMLILSASQAGIAADARILNTLIGTAFGLSVVLLFPMPPRLTDALEAVGEVALSTADRAEILAKTVESDELQPTVMFRKIQSVQPQIEEAKRTIHDTRRQYLMNWRSTKTPVSYDVNLIQAVEALEDCLPQLQKIILNLNTRVYTSGDERLSPEVVEHLKMIYSSALTSTASTLRAFGEHFVAEPERRAETKDRLAHELGRLKASEESLSELATTLDPETSSYGVVRSMIASMRSISAHLDLDSYGSYNASTREIVSEKMRGITFDSTERAREIARDARHRISRNVVDLPR